MSQMSMERAEALKKELEQAYIRNAEQVVAKLDKEFNLSEEAKAAVKKEVEAIQHIAFVQGNMLLIVNNI